MLTFTATASTVVDTTTPDPTLSDVDMSAPVPARQMHYGHATAAELRMAAAAGQYAHATGAPRAPAASQSIRDLIAPSAVGEPRTLQLFHAFTDAFDAETNREAAALLAV